jgi:hypothetical protein
MSTEQNCHTPPKVTPDEKHETTKHCSSKGSHLANVFSGFLGKPQNKHGSNRLSQDPDARESVHFQELGSIIMSSAPVVNTLLPFEIAFGIFLTTSICDRCEKKKADLECKSCKMYLCFTCFPLWHHEKKIKDDHMKFAVKANVPYEEIRNRGIKCLIHGVDVDLYDTTTKSLICEKCAEDLKGHTIKPIDDAFPEMQVQLEQKISLNKKRAKLYKMRNQKMEKILKGMLDKLEEGRHACDLIEDNNYKHVNSIKSWKELTSCENDIKNLFEEESKVIQENYLRLKAIDKESPYYHKVDDTDRLCVHTPYDRSSSPGLSPRLSPNLSGSTGNLDTLESRIHLK